MKEVERSKKNERWGADMVNKLLARHGSDSKKIHKRILDIVNGVQNTHTRTSNKDVNDMWARYKEIFPS